MMTLFNNLTEKTISKIALSNRKTEKKHNTFQNVFKCFVLENSKIKLKINDNPERCASRIIMRSASFNFSWCFIKKNK